VLTRAYRRGAGQKMKYWIIRNILPLFRGSCLPSEGEVPTNISIGIVTFFVAPMGTTNKISNPSWVDTSIQNKRAYADKHGYEFVDASERALVLRNKYVDNKAEKNWLKVAVLLENLEKWDWMFYVDVDAWISNDNIPLQLLLRGVEKKDFMVLTRDYCGLNSGVFFLRNSPSAMQLLKEWISYSFFGEKLGYSRPPEVPDVSAFSRDQRALKNIYNLRADESYRFSLSHKKFPECNSVSYKSVEGFRILPQCAMNSAPNFDLREYTYMTGDFIVHMFGCPSQRKSRSIKSLARNQLLLNCQ